MRKNKIVETNDFMEDAMLLTPPVEFVCDTPRSGGHFVVSADIIMHEGREHTYVLICNEDTYRSTIRRYLSSYGDELPITFDVLYYAYSLDVKVYNVLALRVTATFVPDENATSAAPNLENLILRFHDFINHVTNAIPPAGLD